jgi:hypothetical protein
MDTDEYRMDRSHSVSLMLKSDALKRIQSRHKVAKLLVLNGRGLMNIFIRLRGRRKASLTQFSFNTSDKVVIRDRFLNE